MINICPFCNTTIDEHEAGRCLDAWVAEIIFDNKVRVNLSRPSEFDVYLPAEVGGLPEGWKRGEIFIPHYSTDMGAAWMVVEKLWPQMPVNRYKGRICGTFRFQLNRYEGESGMYVCEFAPDKEGDFSTHIKAHAPTAPLAICRAGIKVKEDGE